MRALLFALSLGLAAHAQLVRQAANTATLFSHKPLLTILDRETNHNGGDLHFGADGFPYLSLGENPHVNDPPYVPAGSAAQTLFSLTFTQPANR